MKVTETNNKEYTIYFKHLLITSLISLSFISYSFASPKPNEVSIVPIINLELSGSQLWATIRYQNTCLKPWLTYKYVKRRTITLYHFGEQFEHNVCTRAVQYSQVSFDMEELKDNDYTLVDGSSGNTLGLVDIRKNKAYLETIL